MEHQLEHTTICPVCGSVSTNHLNCDSCGSFWVQFAEKENVKTWIEKAQRFDNPGLEQTLEKYCELLRTESSLNFVLGITHGYKDTYILITPNHLDLKGNPTENDCTGFKARIRAQVIEFDAYDRAKFENSTTYFVFKRETSSLGRIHDYDQENKTINYYTIDFGFDFKGAAQLLTQISQEVLQCNPDLFVYDIGLIKKNCFKDRYDLSVFYDDTWGDSYLIDWNQSVRYNSAGMVIRANGDGEAFFGNLISNDKKKQEIKTIKVPDSHAIWVAVEDYLSKTKEKSSSRLYLDILGPAGEVYITLSVKYKSRYTMRINPQADYIEFMNKLKDSPVSNRIHAVYYRSDSSPSIPPIVKDIKLSDHIYSNEVKFIQYYWSDFRFQPREIYNTIMTILSIGYEIDPSRVRVKERKESLLSHLGISQKK